MASTPHKCPAWQDQFRTPTARELADGFNKHNAALFEATLGALRAVPGLREEISWQGVPWCWSFVFHNGTAEAVPVAMLVPDCAMPKVVVPMPAGVMAHVRLDDLSAELKSVVSHSVAPCGTAWPAFDIGSKTRLEVVLSILRRRLDAAHPKRGGSVNGTKRPH